MNLRIILLSALPFLSAPLTGASCERLAALAIPHTAIKLAKTVPSGEFSPRETNSAPAKKAPVFRDLPAFCRVIATLTPSSDSEIAMEVWIPSSGWNGRFQGVGNGGWAGTINYGGLAAALRQGYATASTDTGHTGQGASFLMGHPEKLIDFAYRAVHEMTVSAKAIIAALEGQPPRFSYWNGCSTGGRQGLKEAQNYPADYDGIIAGAPANHWTHLQVGSMWVYRSTHQSSESYIPPVKYGLIHRAVLQACDALDGVTDLVLEDPTKCPFDPKVLLCRGDDTSSCLTAAQVEAASNIYAAVKNPRTGKEINPGLEPGSEMGWAALAGPEPVPGALDEFRYQAFHDPNWTWRNLNFDEDVVFTDKADNGLVNASNPDLRPFISRGGKLLLYQGWADQLVAPLNIVGYYKAVEYALGSPEDSVRLFMAPGMAHCGNGDGPSEFDKVGVIQEWVERKKAPDRIIATKSEGGKPARTRPLCPYPQIARYKGSGSTDDAANFACVAP